MAYFGTISAKDHYVLRMMLCVAKSFYDQKPVSLAQIRLAEHISLKYLEQLVRPFVKARWLQSIRGRDGGYILLEDPKNITLKDILWISETHHATVQCLDERFKGMCFLEDRCISQKAWARVQQAIEKALDEITMAELLVGTPEIRSQQKESEKILV